MDFIKKKKISVIDASLFHIGCAYFVQCNDHGGSWFTGILRDVTEEALFLVMSDGETYRINVDELEDPEKCYKITLMVPVNSQTIQDIVKQQDHISYCRYMGKKY